MSRLARSILGAAIVLAVAACSASATTAPPAAAQPTTSGASAAVEATPAPSGAPAASVAAAGACAVSTAAPTVNDTIKGFAFSPNPATAKVGDVVGWKNNDSTSHTVTMDDGSCSTARIAPGSVGVLTFTAPGTYTFHCAIHPSMKATITVSG